MFKPRMKLLGGLVVLLTLLALFYLTRSPGYVYADDFENTDLGPGVAVNEIAQEAIEPTGDISNDVQVQEPTNWADIAPKGKYIYDFGGPQQHDLGYIDPSDPEISGAINADPDRFQFVGPDNEVGMPIRDMKEKAELPTPSYHVEYQGRNLGQLGTEINPYTDQEWDNAVRNNPGVSQAWLPNEYDAERKLNSDAYFVVNDNQPDARPRITLYDVVRGADERARLLAYGMQKAHPDDWQQRLEEFKTDSINAGAIDRAISQINEESLK